MANTVIGPLNDLTIKRVQEKLISTIAERQNPYSKFIGSSQESPIQVLTDLSKQSGDTVQVNLAAKLKEDGVNGDATLEGNEEEMSFYNDKLSIDQKRKAIRLDGVMTEQRSIINLRREAGLRLATWGREWITELLTYYLYGTRGVRSGELILPLTFTGFAGNSLCDPTLAGNATRYLDLAGNLTCASLDALMKRIKLLINTGVAMRPTVTQSGRKYFPLIITPEQWYDLRRDSEWQASQREAGPRDESNPIFSGAEGTYGGFVIHVNESGVLLDANGDGTPDHARAIVLGAQSACLAYGKTAGGSEAGGGKWDYLEKSFDYDNKTGFRVATVLGVKKLQFQSRDFGVFTMDTHFTA